MQLKIISHNIFPNVNGGNTKKRKGAFIRPYQSVRSNEEVKRSHESSTTTKRRGGCSSCARRRR